MRTIKLSAIIFILSIITATAQNSWRMGIYFGSTGNHYKYIGGDQTANGRFHNNNYGAGIFGLNFRKTYTPNWSLQLGLQFSSIGFKYAIAADYNLNTPEKQLSSINEFKATTFSIPILAVYHTNPNCKNWRWYGGLGLNLNTNNAPAYSHINSSNLTETGNAFSNYLTQDVTKMNGTSLNAMFIFGREKTFKSGRTWGIGFIGNIGLMEQMRSTVNYNLSNQDYSHTFVNYGTFAGIHLSYYFKNFHSTKKSPN